MAGGELGFSTGEPSGGAPTGELVGALVGLRSTLSIIGKATEQCSKLLAKLALLVAVRLYTQLATCCYRLEIVSAHLAPSHLRLHLRRRHLKMKTRASRWVDPSHTEQFIQLLGSTKLAPKSHTEIASNDDAAGDPSCLSS